MKGGKIFMEHNNLDAARWLEVYSNLSTIKPVEMPKFFEIYNHIKIVHTLIPEDNSAGTEEFFRHYSAVIFRGESLGENTQ